MSIEEIKEALYRYYEIEEEYYDGERGGYVNGHWLSVDDVIEVLRREF